MRCILATALLSSIVPTEQWEPKETSLVCHMANETTSTSMNDVTNDSVVIPVMIAALSERPGLAIRHCREFDITNLPSATAKIPKQASYWGTPGDRGAAVDTELDGADAVGAGNTQVSTDGVQIGTPEYVVAHALSDRLPEDGVFDGAALLTLLSGPMLTALMLALDDDYVALYPGLSNAVGSTGTDLTLAQSLAAVHGIVTRGANCDAIEFVLDPEQVSNVHTAVLATNAAAAVYAASADRLIGFDRTPMASRGMGRVMQLDGCIVTQSGLCDTVAAGADVCGAALCPTTAQNDTTGATTFALAWKRLPRFEAQRQAKGRATDLVMSMRAGVAELQDGSGTEISTDAPA